MAHATYTAVVLLFIPLKNVLSILYTSYNPPKCGFLFNGHLGFGRITANLANLLFWNFLNYKIKIHFEDRPKDLLQPVLALKGFYLKHKNARPFERSQSRREPQSQYPALILRIDMKPGGRPVSSEALQIVIRVMGPRPMYNSNGFFSSNSDSTYTTVLVSVVNRLHLNYKLGKKR